MEIAKSNRRYAFLGLTAVFLFAGSMAWMLWEFPPERYRFYPTCPLHAYLHIECPGCGATRAMAMLLHGHLGEALRLNALMVGIMLPLTLIYAGMGIVRLLREEDFRWPVVPKAATFALLGIAAVFTLARNF